MADFHSIKREYEGELEKCSLKSDKQYFLVQEKAKQKVKEEKIKFVALSVLAINIIIPTATSLFNVLSPEYGRFASIFYGLIAACALVWLGIKSTRQLEDAVLRGHLLDLLLKEIEKDTSKR